MVGGTEVALTALEFRLLKTLLERPGRVQTGRCSCPTSGASRRRSPPAPWTRTSSGCREKLGVAGDIIETVRGVGYKLASPDKDA
jgi:two-component system phosphate regulon response regulator PhoB